MKWEMCRLINSAVQGKDALENEISQDYTAKSVFARFSPWNETELALKNRTVTKNSRKILVRCTFGNFPQCEKAEMNGEIYKIIEIKDLNRFTLLYAEKTKD